MELVLVLVLGRGVGVQPGCDMAQMNCIGSWQTPRESNKKKRNTEYIIN